jgi:hypothetical protein
MARISKSLRLWNSMIDISDDVDICQIEPGERIVKYEIL